MNEHVGSAEHDMEMNVYERPAERDMNVCMSSAEHDMIMNEWMHLSEDDPMMLALLNVAWRIPASDQQRYCYDMKMNE